ncbi:glycosyltransferase family 2 protein [Labrys neptuniae]
MRYDLAVVVPTLNEAANIAPLLARFDTALRGLAWEAIFVDDDSNDGTAREIRRLAETRPNLRCLSRVGRRGLASAAVEGMMATGAPFIAVIDADLQHDEALLPAMLARLEAGDLDLVVASRFAPGSDTASFPDRRRRLSGLGIGLARLIAPSGLSDPLSGFFMLRREVIIDVVGRLYGGGFKILLDIVSSARRPLRIAELPMRFGSRLAGASKLDFTIGLDFLGLVFDKTLGRLIPLRFVLFLLVGLSGLMVNLVVVAFFLHLIKWEFFWAQAIAIQTAMISNFLLNNVVTHRDRRLHGWAMLRGLASFCIACLIGASLNLTLSSFLYESGLNWSVASLVGAAYSSMWNYMITATLTWRVRGRQS